MEIKFHGAAKEVGRSCIELITGEGRYILDCGIKVGKTIEHPTQVEAPEDIKAVFISHAHLDHTGHLPVLDYYGLKCSIFTNELTKEITKILLKDSWKIEKLTQQNPIYSKRDINKIMSYIQKTNLNKKYKLNDIEYKYFDAGHIPGSASIFMKIDGKNLLYTGDINTKDTELLNGADTSYPEVDVMIAESTYGNRDHLDREEQKTDFFESISKTLKNKGSVIIPTFAVGRAQEIILMLAKEDFGCPVYMDGMALGITEQYIRSGKYLKNGNKLKVAFNSISPVDDWQQRQSIMREKAIFITTAGMCDGGPVIGYIKELGNDKKNSILLTGYQAVDSNGRSILEKNSAFIDNKQMQIKALVKRYDFSAHAGKTELELLIKKVNPKVLILNHGEEGEMQNLAELGEDLGCEVHMPELDEKIVLE